MCLIYIDLDNFITDTKEKFMKSRIVGRENDIAKLDRCMEASSSQLITVSIVLFL